MPSAKKRSATPIRGATAACPAVPYLEAAVRSARKRRIHARRIVPRVAAGEVQPDANPTSRLSLRRSAAAAPAEHARRRSPMPSTRGDAGELVFHRNVRLSDVATADTASHTCEPTVAVNGDVVFLAGNWFASASFDGGRTFRFVDPAKSFPDPPGMSFCCDQVIQYVRKLDTWVWLLQYDSDRHGNNVERLAFATTAELREGRWRLFDLSSRGLGHPGLFLDYPDLALGSNSLYVSLNGFRGSDWERSIVVRIPYRGIRSGKIAAQKYESTELFNFRVAQHVGTSAYWASHVNTRRIRVWRWPESAARPTSREIGVASWSEDDYLSRGPDGRKWLARVDSRITGATLAGSELWFAWTAGRGGVNERPHPYVQIARVRARDLTLVRNVNLWDPESAIAFPALTTNGRGEVGVSYAIGGGPRHPAHVVGILSGERRESVAFRSTRGPDDSNWGDYLTIRRAYPSRDRFAAAGYTLLAGRGEADATPNFTVFSRRS